MILAIFLIILALCTIYQSLALNRIEKLIQSTKQIEREIQYKMALDFSALTTKVAALTTVDAGVVTVLQALQTEVETLAGNQQDPADQQKLNDFATQIGNASDALAAAVANVPAKDLPPVAIVPPADGTTTTPPTTTP